SRLRLPSERGRYRHDAVDRGLPLFDELRSGINYVADNDRPSRAVLKLEEQFAELGALRIEAIIRVPGWRAADRMIVEDISLDPRPRRQLHRTDLDQGHL